MLDNPLSQLTNEHLVSLTVSATKLHDEGSLSTSPALLEELEVMAGLATDGPKVESPQDFRRRLMIDARGTEKPLEECLDPWQREDYEALDAGWRKLLTGEGDGKLRAYIERPRGHSKTTDIAVQILYALACYPKRIRGVAASGDKDQAALIRKAVDDLVRSNPWLTEVIDVQRHAIVNTVTGSEIEIISSDAASSYGHTVDVIICDELTHWKKRDLWDSLFSTVPKKVCLLIIIANAGLGQGTSWQWTVREMARTEEKWHFSTLEGPQASWQAQEDLEEQARGLPPLAFRRLWLNQWTVESGDCFTVEDIEACTVQQGGIPRFDPAYEPFVAGLDFGIRRHHTALVVLGVHAATGKVRLAECKWWDPRKSKTGKVDLEKVLEAVRGARRRYKLFKLSMDPSQAEWIQQQLEADMLSDPTAAMRIEMVAQVGKNLHAMADAMVNALNNRLVELYPDPALKHDLLKLSIVEKQSGFHLTSPEDELGHADRAIAMALAMPGALEMAKELHLRPIEKPAPPRQGDWRRW